MLDFLLVIIAIVVGGACVGLSGLSGVRDGIWSWRSIDAFQQTYGAQSFRASGFWPGSFLPGAGSGSFFGFQYPAVAAALARRASNRTTASLDGWSDGTGLR